MGRIDTYKDFADNDSCRFIEEYEAGKLYYGMAADGQEICEKYLKHLVSILVKPDTEQTNEELTRVMKTHNLRALLNYLRETAGLELDRTTENDILLINGLYFSTRYPGIDAIAPTQNDMDQCYQAIKTCQAIVEQVEKVLAEDDRVQDENEHNQSPQLSANENQNDDTDFLSEPQKPEENSIDDR